ncbi:unnamed protein product [Merluccius merluccius]
MENTASSNTSISFTWDISSPRCPAISSLKNLSYSCGCALKATDIRNNDKALIGFLVFLILITSVALAMVLYKIFILQRNKSE